MQSYLEFYFVKAVWSISDTAQKNIHHWHKSIFFSITQRSSQMSCVYSAEHKPTNIESSARLYVHRLTHKHKTPCDVWIYVIAANWVKGLLWCWVNYLKCLSVYLLGLDYSWNGTQEIEIGVMWIHFKQTPGCSYILIFNYLFFCCCLPKKS